MWDKVGIGLSFLCLVHCMALPFVFMFIPAVSSFSESDSFHTIMVFLVTLTAAVSFIPGYLRHKDKKLVVKVSVGLILVVLGIVLGHDLGVVYERIITSIGSLILVYSHFRNIRHKGDCSSCEQDDHELQP